MIIQIYYYHLVKNLNINISISGQEPWGRHCNTKIHQLYTSGMILTQGANLQLSREQGDTKIDLASTKNYFGEHQKNNSGSREKRFKFQREPGAGDPPLRGLIF